MKQATPFIKLDHSFDAKRIMSEIHTEWHPHFMKEYAEAGNDALLLVTTEGTVNHKHQYPMVPTPALDAMPYTKSIWDTLGIPFERARFMRINPKSEMPRHHDVQPYWDDKVRLHIPVKTSDYVNFYCGGETINMKEGECWLMDNSRLHGVVNNGDDYRIHLVIDVFIGSL
jgi:hypothetical protein